MFSPRSNYGFNIAGVANGEGIWSFGLDLNKDGGWTQSTGTSMAAAQAAGIFATFVAWEKLNNNFATVGQRFSGNATPDILTSVPANTLNRFINTGINNPGKDAKVPYLGAPAKEVLAADEPNQKAGLSPTSTLGTYF